MRRLRKFLTLSGIGWSGFLNNSYKWANAVEKGISVNPISIDRVLRMSTLVLTSDLVIIVQCDISYIAEIIVHIFLYLDVTVRLWVIPRPLDFSHGISNLRKQKSFIEILVRYGQFGGEVCKYFLFKSYCHAAVDFFHSDTCLTDQTRSKDIL